MVFRRPCKYYKHGDNLKVEGDFASRTQESWHKGERVSKIHHKDNLKIEGAVLDRDRGTWKAGERTTIVKHSDNLKVEETIVV